MLCHRECALALADHRLLSRFLLDADVVEGIPIVANAAVDYCPYWRNHSAGERGRVWER